MAGLELTTAIRVGAATAAAVYSQTFATPSATGDKSTAYDVAAATGYALLLALNDAPAPVGPSRYGWGIPLVLNPIIEMLSRFPGDPGAGNFYVGWDGGPESEGSLSNGRALSSAPLSVYHDYSTAADARVQSTKLDIAISNNMIASQSFKLITWSPAQILAGSADAAIADSISICQARTPWPIWLCYYHEPEDNFTTSDAAADYRAAYRYIVQAFRTAGVTNVAWQPIYQCPWTFDGSGRDWRWWHPDWNGGNTNTIADWYTGSDRMMDMMGLDVYNPLPGGTTSHQFSTMVNHAKNDMSAAGYPEVPITCPEFGMSYHASPLPNWLTWCNAAISFAKANDIVSIQYWNHSGDASRYDFDALGDPDGTKLQGWHAMCAASVVCEQGGAD